jgi:hypothetical protein
MTIHNIKRIVIIFLVLSVLAIAPVVFAHGDEESEEVEKSEMSVPQMEQMIKVLNQLVSLLTQYKAQYGAYTPTPAYIAPSAPKAEEHHEEVEAEEDHDEAATEGDHDEAAATPAPATVTKLTIEIEEHSGKTHAHVRYIDGRPEAMFFVDQPISNEAAVVDAISAKTGLGKEEVKNALKYTGMQ